jgi:hypothetical protein
LCGKGDGGKLLGVEIVKKILHPAIIRPRVIANARSLHIPVRITLVIGAKSRTASRFPSNGVKFCAATWH